MITRFHYSFNDTAVYVQNNYSPLGNQSCTIKPRLLEVNVTYNRDGFVTLVPVAQQPTDIPTHVPMTLGATYALAQHFVDAQRISGNNILDNIHRLIFKDTPRNILVRMH